MTPKISKLFDELEEDLQLTGLEPFANRVARIKKSLTPMQKKVPVKGTALKLEITEYGRTTEVIFATEKEAEKYLTLKQKQRLKDAKSPEGLSVPFWDDSNPADYKQKCAKYWQAAQDQNLIFRVKITKA